MLLATEIAHHRAEPALQQAAAQAVASLRDAYAKGAYGLRATGHGYRPIAARARAIMFGG